MTLKATPSTTIRLPGAPWSLPDAAKYIGISIRHLHRLIDAEKIRSITIGRRRMIVDAEVVRVTTQGVQ